jgi:hypothetical protein
MRTETIKTKSIVKLDPKQYGLTETKAKEIEAMFAPMLTKMVELETEFNEVSGLEVNKSQEAIEILRKVNDNQDKVIQFILTQSKNL